MSRLESSSPRERGPRARSCHEHEHERGLAFLAPAALALAACISSPDEPQIEWEQDVAFRHAAKLGGCAVGDLLPEHAGEEIAVACATGEVFVVRPEGGGWRQELALHAAGEMIQCATGDLDPEHPGEELFAVGMLEGGEDDGGPGAAWVARRASTGQWASELLLQDDALVHAVAIGDVDPTHEGEELVVSGLSRRVHVLALDAGVWRTERIGELPGGAKGAACDGARAIFACDDGSLVAFERRGEAWTSEVLVQWPEALARVDARDGAILCSSNDGRLRLFRDGTTEVLYRSTDRTRGAVIADLTDAWPGPEHATGGYDGRVIVVHEGEGGWIATEVAKDHECLHHLACGRVGGELALVSCGYSGEVIVVRPMPRPIPR